MFKLNRTTQAMPESAHRNVCLRPCHDLLHEHAASCLDLQPLLSVLSLPQLVLLI